jgi:hypothetical protein
MCFSLWHKTRSTFVAGAIETRYKWGHLYRDNYAFVQMRGLYRPTPSPALHRKGLSHFYRPPAPRSHRKMIRRPRTVIASLLSSPRRLPQCWPPSILAVPCCLPPRRLLPSPFAPATSPPSCTISLCAGHLPAIMPPPHWLPPRAIHLHASALPLRHPRWPPPRRRYPPPPPAWEESCWRQLAVEPM